MALLHRFSHWRERVKQWHMPGGLRLKFAMLFYLVTFAILAVVGFYGYTSAGNAYRGKAEELLRGYSAETAQKIISSLETARSDAAFHSNSYDLLRYAYWLEMGDAVQAEYWRKSAAESLRNFAESYKTIYTLRLLDKQGQERIEVRRDPASEVVGIIADDELVDRSGEEYFSWAVMLPKGDMFVSKMDLNKRGKQVEKPYVPVVRFSIPLVGGNNVTYGVVVTNLFAEKLFDYIRKANDNRHGRRFYLIDSDGDYLFHNEPGKMFGRVLGHDANFQRDFPGLLPAFDTQELGLLSAQGKFVAYQHIYPLPGFKGRRWTLVGVVEQEVALAELTQFKYVFLALAVIIGLLVLGITRFYLARLIRPLSFVTQQLQRLGQGQTSQETIEYHGRDEISQMLDSNARVLANMERLASQADSISQGDFSSRVALLSEQDRLGKAINNMTAMLEEAKARDERSAWLSGNVSQLGQLLVGDLSAQQLAEVAVSFVGRCLEAGRGVFYTFRPEQASLELLGSYMYTERDAVGAGYKLGEGAVGQVAREKKPIILHAVQQDAAPIATGTLCLKPLFTYTYPLLRDEELLGVVEFAAFERFSELKLEFLLEATKVVASFLFIAEQRERIQNLLTDAELSAQQAREESGKVQAANALLEEQQQQLQQQTEELQQANAQMEEQQQQLQQQTEELQQANAQMEEQQQQLRLQTSELEQRNADLNRSREDLQRKAEQLELAGKYKSEFLANMSHELRTPLNSIILLSKMLGMNDGGKLGEEEVKRLSVIHQSGEELLRLINDILDLSKIESGRMEVRWEEINTSDLLDEVHSLFEASAREKGLDFRLEPAWQGRFVCDHDKLAQIVRNLLANAIKFTKQGRVVFRIEREAGAPLPIRIAVGDSGIGIPREKQDLIFQAFHQVDGSISREFGGTGLGLTISLRFAELLGGTITVQSEPGRGSTFTLHLPERQLAGAGVPLPAAAPPAGQAETTAQPSAAAGVPVVVDDDRAKLKTGDTVILLIDDDVAFGQVLARLNHKLGYKTLIALNGEEGLRLAKVYRPKGILLDLGLPDLDGSEVLHRLKAEPELRGIPVYIVSARDKQADLLKQGIVGYLQKPVDFESLAEAEAMVVQRAADFGKTVLVLEGGSLGRAEVAELVGDKGKVLAVASQEAALEQVRLGGVAVAILDMEREGSVLECCRQLHEADPAVPILLYGVRPLSEEDAAALSQHSDSIILKKPKAQQRMLENIERFLQYQVPSATAVQENRMPVAGKINPEKLAGKTILVVDDDPRNLFVITAALEQAGAHVDSVLNGAKAMEYLGKHKPDLIFMDIMMPEMDGYEAIRRIKESERLRQIPVVALTAKALRSDKEKAVEVGAEDFLAKPVDYDVLINTACLWCGGGRP
jgi:signal transduction histidine kinase/DNA-binding response OmpR family regulator